MSLSCFFQKNRPAALKIAERGIIKFFTLTFIIIFAASALTAQTRINFRSGRSSATVRAKIQNNGSRQYVVRARAGQTLSLQMTSTTGAVTISTRAHSPGTNISYQLEQDGDVNLFVENSGAATSFRLTVTIR